MKKFLAGMAAVLALTVAMTGCGKKDAGSGSAAASASAPVEAVKPENVAKQYFEAIAKGDTEGAKKLVFMGEIKDREGFNKVLLENFGKVKEMLDQQGGLESVNVDPAQTQYFKANPQDLQHPTEIKAADVQPGTIANVNVMLKLKNAPAAGGSGVQLVNTGNNWAIVIRGSEEFAK